IRQCFDNVEHILKAVGGRFEDMVSLTIYFVNANDMPTIQRVRAEKLPPETAPTSILIQAAGLVIPEILVELVPIAVIPFERYHEPRW
ncbi:RidA family protein, partial [Tabrizicola sp.]|uniref:RidA family protein n=1 Tax=Tabrizicola sp. TaxID=2005166 RepID=UPI003F2F4F0D